MKLKLLVEEILAAMLSLSPPGHSTHSQIPIPYCDEKCQQTYLCDNTQDFRCKPPKYNDKLFEEIREKLFITKLHSNKEFNMIEMNTLNNEARLYSFSRPETYEEGFVRYRIIAEAIVKASELSTNSICTAKCTKKDFVCRKKCSKTAPWKYDQKSLAFSTLLVMSFESNFRSDVHGGQKRGDCSWRMSNGKVARPNAPGAKFTCRSTCLGQKQIKGGKDFVTGWTPEDLVGIDYASTLRCSIITAHHLANSRNYCMGRWASGKGRGKDWANAMFAMYGTGRECESAKLAERGPKFWRYFNESWSLDEQKKILLEKTESTIKTLLYSKHQIYWMLPVTLKLKDLNINKEQLSLN